MNLPEGWVAASMFSMTFAAPEQATLDEMNAGEELATPAIMAMIGPPDEMAEGVDTVEELTDQMLTEEFEPGEDMTVGEPSSLTVGGLPATAVDFSGTDPDTGQDLSMRMITVLGPEHAGSFFGIAPQDQWDDFSPTFDEIIASVTFFEPNPEAAFGDLGEFEMPEEGEATFTGDAALGETMSGTMEDGGTHDWTFQGTAGDTVTVTVQPGSDDFDPKLAIIGPDGSVVSETDDGFSGEPEEITLTLPDDGSYVARITSFGFTGGPYTITVEGAGAAAGEIRQWAARASASSQYGSDSWAAGQATGAPDTYPECGDIQTAWATESSDGVDYIELEYDTPVFPTRLEVYQTYNPGAISKIELVDITGTSHGVYVDSTPTVMDACPYILGLSISVVTDDPIDRVIIYLDQSKTNAWCEIDAVELIGTP
jgi:hypothetical protein